MRDPAELRSVVTGCKLSKLGSNNIETPKHFSPFFVSFLRYFWYKVNTKNGMCILELISLYEYIISLLFHEKKLFHILVGALKRPFDWSHIRQGHFTCSGTVLRLTEFKWRDSEEYGWRTTGIHLELMVSPQPNKPQQNDISNSWDILHSHRTT